MKENNYRPLPDSLHIGTSIIEGNGLFTTKELKEGEELGITHISYNSEDFHSNYIRTPLGGFVNHNKIANCELYECGEYLRMKTSKKIKVGEELTLTYNLYDPCKNYMEDIVSEDVSEKDNIFGKVSGSQYKELIEGYQNKSGEEFNVWYESLSNEERVFISSMFD